MEKVIYSKYSNQRSSKFAIRTDIIQVDEELQVVRKYPMTVKSKKHMDNIINSYKNLQDVFAESVFKTNSAEKKESFVEFEFLIGNTLEEILDECIKTSNQELFVFYIKKYASEVRKIYGKVPFEITEEFIKVFGEVNLPQNEMAAINTDIDLIFQNIIVIDDVWHVIDYEWTFDFPIPVNYVIWRAVKEYTNSSSTRLGISFDDLCSMLDIDIMIIPKFEAMEYNFQYNYCYNNNYNLFELYNSMGKHVIKQDEISNKIACEEELYIAQIYYGFGEGFCEENSEFCIPWVDNEKKCHLGFCNKDNIKCLRLDPAQKKCIIEIYKAIAYKDDKKYNLSFTSNGYEISSNVYVIENDDPQMHINDLPEDFQRIEIIYGINLLDNDKSYVSASRELPKAVNLLNDKDKELVKKENEFCLIRDKLQNTQIILNEKQEELQNTQIILKEMQEKLQNTQNSLRSIMVSRSWRITAPIRKMSDLMRKSRSLRFIWRIIRSFKNEGISASLKKIPKVIKRHTKYTDNTMHVCKDNNKTIAVHLHLYYEDLLQEFCDYFNNITESFDLYISVKEGVNKKNIKRCTRKIKNVKKIIIRETPNRGRDIAPFYILFGKELQQYDFLLHVHSKKSLYTGEERKEWRHWALDGVLKNCATVEEVLRLLVYEDNVGLVYGEMLPQLSLFAMHWLKNVPKSVQLLSKLNIPFENEMLFYPVGSFFWVKTDAIKPLFELDLKYDDFDEENRQIDGTLAHALERIIAVVTEHRGYNTYIYDQENESFSKNISYKCFEQYFGYSVKNNVELLSQYDIVTFDIFDTLVTRMVYKPDDLFLLIERIASEKYNIKLNYLYVRKTAENKATEDKGDFCNIDDIYEKMTEITNLSMGQINLLKQLEIDLEYKLCYPRKDALKVFNCLKEKGKRIILVTDMYLTREIIMNILKNCGYEGYEDIWLSCEKGLRKDKDNMWYAFFEQFGKYKTIHVGDNPQSDIQTLADRVKPNLLWLSPRTQFKFSKQYAQLKKYIDTTLENSLMLGYFINVIMYNSPFALKHNGIAQLSEPAEVAEAFFGPLFMTFGKFISSMKYKKFLFLSREGFFLQQLYKTYVKFFETPEKDNCYFYTSRRAASVAQIREMDDIREILTKEYNGKLVDVLYERLGLKNTDIDADINISLPLDIDYVLEMLEPYNEILLDQIEKERAVYEEYLSNEASGYSYHELCVVDVGYSGSIQFYLMKLCQDIIGGCYLAETEPKPPKIGGVCESLYNYCDNPALFKGQLFLEAVASAPHGQVICMQKKDGIVSPILKTDVPKSIDKIAIMQKAIFRYIESFGAIFKNISFEIDKELSETIFVEILQSDILNENINGLFSLNDNYCYGNVNWEYDCVKCEWCMKKS